MGDPGNSKGDAMAPQFFGVRFSTSTDKICARAWSAQVAWSGQAEVVKAMVATIKNQGPSKKHLLDSQQFKMFHACSGTTTKKASESISLFTSQTWRPPSRDISWDSTRLRRG